MAFWGLLLVINSADKSRWCTTHAMQLLVYHKATAIMQGSLGPRLLNSLTEYQLVVKHELLGIICFDDHNKTFRPWNDILQCLICWTCLKITQNVAFEFFNLGIFHQLLPCKKLTCLITLLDRKLHSQCWMWPFLWFLKHREPNGSNSKSVLSIIWNTKGFFFRGKEVEKKVQRDLGDSMLVGKVSLMSSSRK